MPKEQDEFGRWRHVEWHRSSARWGQIKVNLGVQFRNSNPVSRALEGSHRCSKENKLEGQRLKRDKRFAPLSESGERGLRPELQQWSRGRERGGLGVNG